MEVGVHVAAVAGGHERVILRRAAAGVCGQGAV